jgi:hypothetical protein
MGIQSFLKIRVFDLHQSGQIWKNLARLFFTYQIYNNCHGNASGILCKTINKYSSRNAGAKKMTAQGFCKIHAGLHIERREKTHPAGMDKKCIKDAWLSE